MFSRCSSGIPQPVSLMMNWWVCAPRFLKSSHIFPPAGVYSAAFFQQMQQDAFQLLRVDFHIQFGGIHGQGDIFLCHSFDFVHDAFTESGDILLLHFVGFGQGGFQFGQFLDMVGECMQGFSPGSEASSVSSVGSIWAEMFWINLVFSSLCSLAMLMAFFCLRVRMMKRSNTIAPNTSAAARMAASMQSPMMMYCLALRESSFVLDSGQAFIIFLLQAFMFLLGGKRLYGVGP